MIVVTGAAGFIASCLISKLNKEGLTNLVLVDDFSQEKKEDNYIHKEFVLKIDRSEFIDWFKQHAKSVNFVFHIGARTDTTEQSVELLNKLNLDYTKAIWNICTEHFVPLVYASSAATYGLGEHGYEDDETKIPLLKPLNPYGDSKNEFDIWALKQKACPPKWVGFKFFNVYGPNEYHKGRMASTVFHWYNQLQEDKNLRLFRNSLEYYRDFIYVEDVARVIWHFVNNYKPGVYDVGTGAAHNFETVANNLLQQIQGKKKYIDMPADLQKQYQTWTKANTDSLTAAGVQVETFRTLQQGIAEYVEYLKTHSYY